MHGGYKLPMVQKYFVTDQDVCIGDRRFPFSFIVADVSQPILGADFLSHFYLAPNHRDKSLIDLSDWSEIPVRINESTQANDFTKINHVSQGQDPFLKLLESYPELSTPSFKPKEVAHESNTIYQPTAAQSSPHASIFIPVGILMKVSSTDEPE